MTNSGRILTASGAGCIQFKKEIGADSENVYIAYTGYGEIASRFFYGKCLNHNDHKGYRVRKLAVHSRNVRHVHIIPPDTTPDPDSDDKPPIVSEPCK